MEVKRKMNDDSLMHFGVQGQKWGVRRYQNADGSLTDAGRKHYGYSYKGKIQKRLDNAKTADEKTYIIRSETRKNDNRSIDADKIAGAAAVGTGITAGVGVGLSTGNPFAGFAAGVITTAIGSVTSGAVAGGIRFVNRYRNTTLANLADKYGIEDTKTRRVD